MAFTTKHLSLFIALFIAISGFSQEKEKLVTADSLTNTTVKIDSSKNGVKKEVRVYNPKTAAIRSAVLPGLGQIYNRKYWKLPIVYGALGVTAGVFFYNLNNYRSTRFAYQAKYKASLPPFDPANPGTGPWRDSTDYFKIKPPLDRYSLETLKYYRDGFRRDIDYSILVFILLWGLNVVDAAVDAHLKAFDVSPDLSLYIKPGHSRMAGTNGVSLVLAIR